MLTRRVFLDLLTGGLVAAPLAARAQQAGRVHQIGIVWGTFPDASQVLFDPLRERLLELGYTEGRDIAFQQRWAEGRPERFPELMDTLVRLKVDVIVVPVNPMIEAAKRATTAIPIVMLYAIDPVGAGFVSSLARPGGNVTGLSRSLAPETFAKILQLLREASPQTSSIVLLANPVSPGLDQYEKVLADVARSISITLRRQNLSAIGEIEPTLAAIRADSRTALLVFPDAATFVARAPIAQWAIKHRVPAAADFNDFAQAGGLLTYGANTRDLTRRAATYIDRILKGAKPADLPVEQPTKFELVINLKTAKALGLTIPPSLLGRADEVIQ